MSSAAMMVYPDFFKVTCNVEEMVLCRDLSVQLVMVVVLVASAGGGAACSHSPCIPCEHLQSHHRTVAGEGCGVFERQS